MAVLVGSRVWERQIKFARAWRLARHKALNTAQQGHVVGRRSHEASYFYPSLCLSSKPAGTSVLD